MMGRTMGAVTGETTLAQFMEEMGFDLQGPALPQLTRFADAQLGNQQPLDKARNVAAGANVMPGAGARAADQVSRMQGAGAGGAPPPGGPMGGGALPSGGGLDSLMGGM